MGMRQAEQRLSPHAVGIQRWYISTGIDAERQEDSLHMPGALYESAPALRRP